MLFGNVGVCVGSGCGEVDRVDGVLVSDECWLVWFFLFFGCGLVVYVCFYGVYYEW